MDDYEDAYFDRMDYIREAFGGDVSDYEGDPGDDIEVDTAAVDLPYGPLYVPWEAGMGPLTADLFADRLPF